MQVLCPPELMRHGPELISSFTFEEMHCLRWQLLPQPSD